MAGLMLEIFRRDELYDRMEADAHIPSALPLSRATRVFSHPPLHLHRQSITAHGEPETSKGFNVSSRKCIEVAVDTGMEWVGCK